MSCFYQRFFSPRARSFGFRPIKCGKESEDVGSRNLVVAWLFVVIYLSCCVLGDDKCFCELKGQIDDCCCSVETVNKLNNLYIYPRISSLVRKSSYLKYFKVNLNKECPFWPNNHHCALKDCSVDVCSEEEIPIGLKGGKERYSNVKDETESKPLQDPSDHGQMSKRIFLVRSSESGKFGRPPKPSAPEAGRFLRHRKESRSEC